MWQVSLTNTGWYKVSPQNTHFSIRVKFHITVRNHTIYPEVGTIISSYISHSSPSLLLTATWKTWHVHLLFYGFCTSCHFAWLQCLKMVARVLVFTALWMMFSSQYTSIVSIRGGRMRKDEEFVLCSRNWYRRGR
jgi:hypothetical protein